MFSKFVVVLGIFWKIYKDIIFMTLTCNKRADKINVYWNFFNAEEELYVTNVKFSDLQTRLH